MPRVLYKIRTLKCHVESESGVLVDKLENLMSLLARLAEDLITKHHVGKDKKAAHERMRLKTCNMTIAQFGELVLYVPLEVPTIDKQS